MAEKKNPEYDFKWCPGCGDFGVRRAIEMSMVGRVQDTKLPVENNVVVAGIGCSGNTVHLLEGPQPYGFHGTHGRTLPVALGVKMARTDLNVLIVAGDGDFLSIGMEHIAPAAARNLDVTAVIMDNAVYGLTKGQSSPTTIIGEITSSTPYGKIEEPVNPLSLYLTLGVSFIASAFSSKVKDMSKMITDAMNHPGFSVVHVQSPCTTYNDNYDILKGNVKKGIQPTIWDIGDDHDSSDFASAQSVIQKPGIPLGVIYRNEDKSMHDRLKEANKSAKEKSVEDLLNSFAIKQ
jgi:2-oxoglutarate ferredoxin oxidoreductase subunit beta